MEREQLKALVKELLMKVMNEETLIPIGVSNHHIHLTEEDYNLLFPNEPIVVKKMLKQPGEFAAEQTVTIIGEKGEIPSVRILGPFRKKSQVELSKTDARKLGLQVPIRLSGDLTGTPGVKVKSKYAELDLTEGAIIAKRHIHMSADDASRLGVEHNQDVLVEIHSEQRSLIFEQCSIRVSERFQLEMHIDTDEANAANITNHSMAKIIKNDA